jgi:glycosyltransferase involved in cell wall biosynthesis
MNVAAVMPVKDEEQWVRYAILSVLPYVDQFIVIDDASTDRTVAEVRSTGIEPVLTDGSHSSSDVRNMGAAIATDADWIWVVDSDEVYTKANALSFRKALEEAYLCTDVSLLRVKWINFVRDRFHWDGAEDLEAVRAYRRNDIQWYNHSLQEVPARRRGDIKTQRHGGIVSAYNTGDYSALIEDSCFYHYSRCDNKLDRIRKWHRYISCSHPKKSSNEVLQEAIKENWVQLPKMLPFTGQQPEVFYE